MTLREWLNAVLSFIGATSLTDEEYDGINFLGLTALDYNQAAYDQLAAVLSAREAISTMQDRLVAVFKAKGTDVIAVETGFSNIYLGDVL